MSSGAGIAHLRGGLRWCSHARLLPGRQGEVKAAVIVRLDIQILVHRVANFELHRTESTIRNQTASIDALPISLGWTYAADTSPRALVIMCKVCSTPELDLH